MAKNKEYNGSTPITGPYAVMREAFVDNIIANVVQYKAYQQAGYKPKTDEVALAASSRLLRNVTIQKRLAYKRAQLAKRMEVTEESQVKRLRELSIGAQNNGQYSASVSAEDRINTLCGLYSKDNAQRGMSIVEILAIVGGNAAMPVIEGETGEQPLLEGTLP